MSNKLNNQPDHIVYLDNKTSTIYRYSCDEDLWHKRVVIPVSGLSEGAIGVSQLQSQLKRKAEKLSSARSYLDVDEDGRAVLLIQGWQELSESEATQLLGLMYEELDWYASQLPQQDEIISSVEETVREEQNETPEEKTNEEKMRLINASIRSANQSLELNRGEISMGRGARLQYLEQMIGCLVERLSTQSN